VTSIAFGFLSEYTFRLNFILGACAAKGFPQAGLRRKPRSMPAESHRRPGASLTGNFYSDFNKVFTNH